MFSRELFCGFAGSLGFLLLCVINAYEKGEKLPSCYHKGPYWCARVGFAAIAGLLPVLLGIRSPAQAFATGICAPLVFQTIWQKALGGDASATAARKPEGGGDSGPL